MIIESGMIFTNPAGVTQVHMQHVIPTGLFPESASKQ
jgi:hypothetical protein